MQVYKTNNGMQVHKYHDDKLPKTLCYSFVIYIETMIRDLILQMSEECKFIYFLP